jgi:hemoglobin-like flavoprotein
VQRLNSGQKSLIRGSFDLIADNLEEIVADFYRRLFQAAPEARAMFPGDMSGQMEKMLCSLEFLIEALDRPEELQGHAQELGRTHGELGTTHAHFQLFVPVFISAVAAFCGATWHQGVADAWQIFLEDVSAQMGFPLAAPG